MTILQHKEEKWGIAGIIGTSQAHAELVDRLQKLRKTSTTSVLIHGESGTGKELIARSIHFDSSRAKAPFIPLNCAAIPLELAESSMFGHIQGAFTGATVSRKGFFELADGGTLFLDEIGDMPPALQVKLLLVLEDQSIVRVGSHHERKVDVRIIAATNVDLRKKMDETDFRKDLFYRLARFIIHVPPLRQRREDITLLTRHFIEQLSRKMGIEAPAIDPQALAMLLAYPFFGNVRELKNIIEHALILCEGTVILPEHLQFIGSLDFCQDKGAGWARSSFGGHAPGDQRMTLSTDQIESIMIKGALVEEDGNIAAAARLLNICPDQVRRIAQCMDTADIPRNHLSDEERIQWVLRKGGTINNTQCRNLLNVNLHRASYLLKKMHREGILEKESTRRWTRYRLADCRDHSVLIDEDDCELNANR